RGMILRDDRVDEFAAGGQRSGSCCRTPRVDDAVTAEGIEDPDRRTIQRRRRKVADALTRARPRAAEPLDHLIAVPPGGGPAQRPVLDDWSAGAAAIQVVERIGQPAA